MSDDKVLRIAGIQISICDGCTKENIGKVYEYLSGLRDGQVDLIALPELWCCGYKDTYTKSDYDNALNAMKDISLRTGALVIGSIPWPSSKPGLFYNRLYAVYRGKIRAFYDKLHLFRPFGEDRVFVKGDGPTILEFKGFRIGFAICYDLRFPELFLSYRGANVDLVVVPSAWGKPRLHQWLSITAAEAAMMQFYLLAVNRVGKSGVGEDFAGHSVLVDAWGDRLSLLGFEEGLVIGVVSKRGVMEARNRLPIYEDRRERDVYNNIRIEKVE